MTNLPLLEMMSERARSCARWVGGREKSQVTFSSKMHKTVCHVLQLLWMNGGGGASKA